MPNLHDGDGRGYETSRHYFESSMSAKLVIEGESVLAGSRTEDIFNRYDVVSAPELCAGTRESGSRSRFEITIETAFRAIGPGRFPRTGWEYGLRCL